MHSSTWVSEEVVQDYKEAVKYLRLAADQGYVRAQLNLAWCFQTGLGVGQDYKKAFRYYRLAADQGDADSACWLGVFFFKGQGVNCSEPHGGCQVLLFIYS